MLVLLLAVAGDDNSCATIQYTTVANLDRERTNDNRISLTKVTDMGQLRMADDHLVCDNMISFFRRSCLFQSQRTSEKILSLHKATDVFLYIGPRFVIINQIVTKVLAQCPNV